MEGAMADADYLKLREEIWKALGVPVTKQSGSPVEDVRKLAEAARKVVDVFSSKDKVGWSPSKLRDAVAELMRAVK